MERVIPLVIKEPSVLTDRVDEPSPERTHQSTKLITRMIVNLTEIVAKKPLIACILKSLEDIDHVLAKLAPS